MFGTVPVGFTDQDRFRGAVLAASAIVFVSTSAIALLMSGSVFAQYTLDHLPGTKWVSPGVKQLVSYISVRDTLIVYLFLAVIIPAIVALIRTIVGGKRGTFIRAFVAVAYYPSLIVTTAFLVSIIAIRFVDMRGWPEFLRAIHL